ncbi:MAG: TIGR01777 family oxidoreductase [Gammaproteobacteria bacterium]|nr:TIGR01777 family oxidoreductase [Gammaproteobacteria bacterium]
MKSNSRSILITGGTGLIGQALIPILENYGHRISVLTRQPNRYPSTHNQPNLFSSFDDIPDSHPVDTIINLAGAQIIGPRWTKQRKHVLRDSRIKLTKNLVHWITKRQTPISTLISGSAVGYYGNRNDDLLDETEPPGDDFGAYLCRDWENESLALQNLGVRVANIRTGLVLSKSGGMLPPMLFSYKISLGAKIGSGRQWMSWIHIEDQVKAICHLVHNSSSTGAYNLAAPAPVSNAEFCDTLARVLNRPRLFSFPAPLLKLMLGEAAGLVLGGQRAIPDRLQQEGYQFRFQNLETAFIDIANS